MKITFEVPLKDSSPSLEDIFKSLTKENKIKIAKDVFKEWLSSDLPFERKNYEQKVIKKLLEEKTYSGKNRYRDEENARKSYDFKREMKNFVSVKDKIIEELIDEMKKDIKNEITNIIKTHPERKKLEDQVTLLISEKFPELILKIFSITLISDFRQNINNNFTELLSISGDMDQIKQKLREF